MDLGIQEDIIPGSLADRLRRSNRWIILNVGGMRFKVQVKHFAGMASSRLSRLVRAETEEEILSKRSISYIHTVTPL